jgi:hypothetical protein
VPGCAFIVAKVIVRCGQPPETHHLVFELQRRRTGADERWRQVKFRETSEIPRPVVTIYDQGHCDAGVTEIWRIYVKVMGTGARKGWATGRPSCGRTRRSLRAGG